MQRKVVIIGAGGHAKVIADIVKKSGDELVGFLDDNESIQGSIVCDDKQVLGTTNEEFVSKYIDCFFIIGIGSNNVRKVISERYHNLKWYIAIHPSAVIANDVVIGEGSVIMAGAVINSGTMIGKHCIINTCSSLDHDNVLGDYVHISIGAHLAGTVMIGECTWICSGATVINNITINKNNIIGAGAVVINDINDINGTYVGIPAKKIK